MTHSRGFGRAAAVAALLLIGLAATAQAQTTVDGLIYANYRYGLTKDSSFSPAAAQNNFDIDRAYINVRSKSDGGITTRLTIDVDGRRAASNQLSFRLKYAYVGWKPEGSTLTWKFGLQGTPLVGFVEDIWGYRMQGPIALDRLKYVSSSDFGIAVEGGSKTGAVNFDGGIYNGETYSSAPGDNRKDLAGRVSFRLKETDNTSKSGGLRLTGFALIGKSTGGADRQRLLGLLSYQTKVLALGAEYALTTDSTAASADTKGQVTSLWASYRAEESKVGFIGRVDLWDPNTDVSPAIPNPASASQTRLIGGVSYQLAKNVMLLLDADVVSVKNGPAANAFEAANRSLFLHTEIKF